MWRGALDAGGGSSRGDPKNWRYMVLAGSWFGVRGGGGLQPAGLFCPWSHAWPAQSRLAPVVHTPKIQSMLRALTRGYRERGVGFWLRGY